jgi:hypothetical protein
MLRSHQALQDCSIGRLTWGLRNKYRIRHCAEAAVSRPDTATGVGACTIAFPCPGRCAHGLLGKCWVVWAPQWFPARSEGDNWPPGVNGLGIAAIWGHGSDRIRVLVMPPSYAICMWLYFAGRCPRGIECQVLSPRDTARDRHSVRSVWC